MTIKCSYCGKQIAGDSKDTCPMCGAPIPKQHRVAGYGYRPAPNKSPVLQVVAGVAGVIALLVVMIGIRFINSAGSGVSPIVSPTPLPAATPAATTQEDPPEITIPSRPYPATAITDPGLRQSLEFFLGRELHHATWDELDEIRTIYATSSHVILSNESIPLANIPNHPNAVVVTPDGAISDVTQLRYLTGLEVVSFPNQISREILLGLPNVLELSVAMGRAATDFTVFEDAPQLRRLIVSGRSMTSLQGLTALKNLYSLGLVATGISDLSLLSQQRNIVDLALTDNRELASFATLQNMYWLTGLHIERSTDRSLAFISELTNLQALSVIRTDTRTYEFILPLVNLRYLRLFDNRDIRDIPSFAGFTQLEELHLETERNQGQVRPSDFLNGLTSVRRMTLHNPDILDPLRYMENLEELSISFGWLLTDASPLGYLSNLRSLRIYESRTFNNVVTGMDSLGRLTNLRRLDISGNDMLFNWNAIYRLPNLEYLNMSNNTVFGDFSGIANLQQLRTLNMERVRLAESYYIRREGGMVSVWWDGQAPVEDFSDSLAQLTQLQRLNIVGNNVRDIGFVAYMTGLRYFVAENNYISDVSPLSDLPNLSFVNLRRNAVINWSYLDDKPNTIILGR